MVSNAARIRGRRESTVQDGRVRRKSRTRPASSSLARPSVARADKREDSGQPFVSNSAKTAEPTIHQGSQCSGPQAPPVL
eukprot:10772196-Karenia_brevis.AAC.1